MMGRLLVVVIACVLFVAAQGVPRIRGIRISIGGGQYIAASYPGDVGIENDIDVIFVEKFEEASIAAMQANWTDSRMAWSSFSTDVPTGSPMGSHSIALTRTYDGSANSGGDHIYKRLSEVDELYVRAYFKYAGADHPDHSGIWLGGYNPAINVPNPGSCGASNGTDKIIAGFEPADDNYRAETYDYYYNQHSNCGEWLLNTVGLNFPVDTWLCQEMRVKVNTPTTALNGEHQVWIDGVQIGYWGEGFPLGAWSFDIWFQPGAGSTPYHGFQWRTTTDLRLNWVWLQNYTGSGDMLTKVLKVDHFVVARRRIGCLGG
jgi:hypothetical protein